MTKKQIRQLKPGDKVWAYKIGVHGDCWESTEFVPTLCTVFDLSIKLGVVRLWLPGQKIPFLEKLSKVFLTESEAAASMLVDIRSAIAQFEADKESLLDTIRDDLDYNNRHIKRLEQLLNKLTHKEAT